MHDYILFMHNDVQQSPKTDADAWGKYLKALNNSGQFLGGSAVGAGKCYSQSGSTSEISAQITGYIRVQAASLEDAQKFLAGNPVFEAGGTVEIRELPQS